MSILILKVGQFRRGAVVELMRELATMEPTLDNTRAEAAPILFLDEILPDAAMPRLFASASRGTSR